MGKRKTNFRPEDLQHHSTITLVHDGLVTMAAIEYTQPDGPIYLTMPVSGIFGEREDIRMKLPPTLLAKISLQPDGSLRLDY